jgi:hypothetical protein
MNAFDYTILGIGLLGALIVVWILFRLCCRAPKQFPIQELSHIVLLQRLEAKYPKKPVTYSSMDYQER